MVDRFGAFLPGLVTMESTRDREILESIARHGLVTAPVVHALFFAGLTAKAAERVLTRLLSQGMIVSHPFIGKSVYYTLTARSARALGLDEVRAVRPLGPQSLAKRFSEILFCAAVTPPRVLLSSSEFKAKFPRLAPTEAEIREGKGLGLSTDRYYIDAGEVPYLGGKPRLALIVTDFRSHQRRLVRKVRKEYHKRACLSGFRELLQADQLLFTVLTPFPKKAALIAAGLSGEPFRARVETVPGYAELLAVGGMK